MTLRLSWSSISSLHNSFNRSLGICELTTWAGSSAWTRLHSRSRGDLECLLGMEEVVSSNLTRSTISSISKGDWTVQVFRCRVILMGTNPYI